MYKIRQTRHYYGPRDVKGYVTDERGDDLTFGTRAAATAAVAEMEEGVYHLSHNESGRPTYRVVRAG
jgi:hypothetical protein